MSELPSADYAALPEVLTPEQAASVLHISTAQLLRWAAEGKVPAKRIGRVWRFSKTRLEELAAS